MFGKILLSTLALGGIAAITLGSIALTSPEPDAKAADRVDCPGTIVCPLTGDEVCKDRCPLNTDEAIAESPSVIQPSSTSQVPLCCTQAQDQ